MTIKICGVPYKIAFKTDAKEPLFSALKADGFTDFSTRNIVVRDVRDVDSVSLQEDRIGYMDKVLRHEIVHAMLHESGLDIECHWVCEEAVDWIALQFPKLQEAFFAANCC